MSPDKVAATLAHEIPVVGPELLEEYEMTLEGREGPLLSNLPGIAVNE